MSIPKTLVKLCYVPFSPTNQLDFENLEKQKEYFESKNGTVFSCHYIKNGKIKLKGFVDSENFRKYNYGYYISYNENSGEEKRYYFWIVSRNYLNKNVSEINYAIDSFQTYLFDFILRPCFIERETVNDDTVGLHTIPEEFEIGDYCIQKRYDISEMKGNTAFIMAITDDSESAIGTLIHRIYSGFKLLYYPSYAYGELTNKIIELAQNGKADSIAFIFAFPLNFLNQFGAENWKVGNAISNLESEFTIKKTITRNDYGFTFNNETYIPMNNKLFTHPFNFISITAPNGNEIALKFELFEGNEIAFHISSTLSQNAIFSLTPLNYDGVDGANYENSIECQPYGLCSWNNDNYANWYASNQPILNSQSENARNSYTASAIISENNANVSRETLLNNIERNALNSAIGVLGSRNISDALSQGASSAVNNYYDLKTSNMQISNEYANANLLNTTNYQNTINSIMSNIKSASVMPNTCKGDTSCSSLDVARDSATFYINEIGIKPEFAKIIDRYFNMFGYKVNIIKTPSFKNRVKWDYLKTLGCVIGGNIPMEDGKAIESMFDNGLRIFHNESYMYQFATRNEIR